MSKRPHDDVLDELASSNTLEKPLKKHTLDSDEEDEEVDSNKYDLMDPEEIEGEEDNTITKDGDIQITPFNMKEEMTEGHFDTEGNYFWKKETVIKDAWLENIDDTKFGDAEARDDSDRGSSSEEEEADSSQKQVDRADILRQMLEILQPGENVAKALRRLGGNKARHSAAARWRERRAGGAQPDTAQTAERRAAMERLTGLADQLLSGGDMEVYQMSREAAAHQLEQQQSAAAEDPELDMFADDAATVADASAPADQAGSSKDTPQAAAAASKDTPQAATAGSSDASQAAEEPVSWEFRWEAQDSAEVHGPHTSAEMHAWAESGYFSQQVQVRRCGTNNFYPAARMDFELYL